MSVPTCCYVVKSWGKHPDNSTNYAEPPVLCGEKVPWMLRHEGGERVRRYKSFCVTHQAIVDAAPAEVDDEC